VKSSLLFQMVMKSGNSQLHTVVQFFETVPSLTAELERRDRREYVTCL